jgi:hypothetical protein
VVDQQVLGNSLGSTSARWAAPTTASPPDE